MLKILVLVSFINTGDLGQQQAIMEALADIQPTEIIINAASGCAKEQYLTEVANLPSNEQYVTLAIGDHGQKLLAELKNYLINRQHNYVILSTHQYSDLTGELARDKVIDHIVIPRAVLGFTGEVSISNVKNKSLLFAVPSSAIDLSAAYNNWDDSNKPSLDKKYIIVTLPGDAPIARQRKEGDVTTIDNQVIRRFTLPSAKELFEDLKKLWQDNGSEHIILLQNSPRTGKYGSNGEIICSHQWNEDQNLSLDHISKEFLAWLNQANMPNIFFNFTFKDGKPSSVYNPLLYIASQGENNYFITPAESTSMMAQVPSYIPSNKNIAFKPDSMNESHQAIFDIAVKRNYLSYFLKDGTIVKSSSSKLRDNNDDLKLLADDIKRGIRNAKN